MPHHHKHQEVGWNDAASWYDKLVGDKGSDYHQNVIIPGAVKMLRPKRGEKILDVACGQGVFSRQLVAAGAEVTGIDASPELIKQAKKLSPDINYLIADATRMKMLADKSFEAASCIMAIMNIDPLPAVLKEVSRVLKPGGRFVMVLNHPCFRVPKQSGWGYDDGRKIQFRRIDSYLSPLKVPIQMQPGYAPKLITFTYHRPLTLYIGALAAAGLAVNQLEEWVSHRVSKPGKRKQAEDHSRNEIPLFMAIGAVRLG